MTTTEFGFTARRPFVWDDEGNPVSATGDSWVVCLPHQCGAWEIAGEDYEPADHATAVAALERFIAEAEDALDALRERNEYGVTA